MELDPQILEMLTYVRSCSFALVALLVAIAAIMAGIRVAKSAGPWCVGAGFLLVGGGALVNRFITLAELGAGASRWISVAYVLLLLLANLLILVGVALIRPGSSQPTEPAAGGAS